MIRPDYFIIAFFSFGTGISFMGLLAWKLRNDLRRLICKYNVLLIDNELLKRKLDEALSK